MKTFFRLLLVLSGALCSSLVFAEDPPPLSKYIDCSNGVGALSLKDRVVLVPANRSGKKGFYIYTDKSAYFYPLGKAQDGNNQFNWYYFQLSVPGRQDIFFTYSDPKDGVGGGPGLGIEGQSKPADALVGKYVKIGGNDALDDASRSAFSASLQTSVQLVTQRYLDEVRYSQIMHRPAPDKSRYERALGACKFDGDKNLRDIVVAESEKLSRANPTPSGGSDKQQPSSASPAR